MNFALGRQFKQNDPKKPFSKIKYKITDTHTHHTYINLCLWTRRKKNEHQLKFKWISASKSKFIQFKSLSSQLDYIISIDMNMSDNFFFFIFFTLANIKNFFYAAFVVECVIQYRTNGGSRLDILLNSRHFFFFIHHKIHCTEGIIFEKSEKNTHIHTYTPSNKNRGCFWYHSKKKIP